MQLPPSQPCEVIVMVQLLARSEALDGAVSHTPDVDSSAALHKSVDMADLQNLAWKPTDTAASFLPVCSIEESLGVPQSGKKRLPELPETYEPTFNEPVIDESKMTPAQAKEALQAVDRIMDAYMDYQIGMVKGGPTGEIVNKVMNDMNFNVDLHVGSNSRCGYGSVKNVHFPGPDNMNGIDFSKRRGANIIGRDADGKPTWVPLSDVQDYLREVVRNSSI